MAIQGYVLWVIHVRTSSVRKLKKTHLPPIETALEGMEFDWEILNSRNNPGLIGLVNYQNLQAGSIAELIIPLLRRAYALSNTWSIAGLRDLSRGELRYVTGTWNSHKPSPKAPALDSIHFELSPG